MVPDLLQPTDETRQLCAHVAADLHEVRGLVSNVFLPRVALAGCHHACPSYVDGPLLARFGDGRRRSGCTEATQ